MKVICSRTRQLKIAVSFYSPARGSRPIYCLEKNPRNRTKRVGSNHLVFRKDAILSFWPYYVLEFGDFFCLTFFVASLLCNLNKIL